MSAIIIIIIIILYFYVVRADYEAQIEIHTEEQKQEALPIDEQHHPLN
jgi:hypothetical protein